MNVRLTTRALLFSISSLIFITTPSYAVKHSTGFSAVVTGIGYVDAYDDLETPEHQTDTKPYQNSGPPQTPIFSGLPLCKVTNGVSASNVQGDGRALCWIFGHGDTEVKSTLIQELDGATGPEYAYGHFTGDSESNFVPDESGPSTHTLQIKFSTPAHFLQSGDMFAFGGVQGTGVSSSHIMASFNYSTGKWTLNLNGTVIQNVAWADLSRDYSLTSDENEVVYMNAHVYVNGKYRGPLEPNGSEDAGTPAGTDYNVRSIIR